MEWIQNLGSIKAARYKSEQTLLYLDMFYGSKFLTEEDFAYMQACEDAALRRREENPDMLYQRYLACLKVNEGGDPFGF